MIGLIWTFAYSYPTRESDDFDLTWLSRIVFLAKYFHNASKETIAKVQNVLFPIDATCSSYNFHILIYFTR